MPFYFDRNGILRLGELEQWPWLVHGFSTRAAGDLARPRNRERFLERAGGGGMKLITLRQVHSAIVRLADGRPVAPLPGDGLLAGRPGLAVGVTTADCLPVLVVDARRRVVAAVHAGWRGLAKRVVQKGVGEMRRCFGCDPSDLHAALGPGIQACCFEVGPEVLDEFASQFVDADRFCRRDSPNPAEILLPRQIMKSGHNLTRRLDSDRGHVDLAEAGRRQLLAAGLPAGQIYDSRMCTACDLARFYSYRRETAAAGRMLAVIGVRAGK